MKLRGLIRPGVASHWVIAEIDGYRQIFEGVVGRSFDGASIFEIGYGARPLRLIALISLGLNARGIDLDAPMLRGSARELLRVLRTNGVARFVKTAVRSVVFDPLDRKDLNLALGLHGASLRIDPERFLVGDMALAAIEAGSVDFFFSEDVFEHIPRDCLDAVCARMAAALSPDGIAVISPSVFTGITGGHLVEWYAHTLGGAQPRRSEPWEHLRRRRFRADCFLNEMRVSDYRALFERHFRVERVINCNAGRGAAFLTDAIRNELSAYDETELLSDKWQFVLRRRDRSDFPG
jgi:SAM-dependent methyltransferase